MSQYKKIIAQVCDEVKALLIAKNVEYGGSIFEPIGVFSSLDTEAQIDVRIDDKLSRLKQIKSMDETFIHEDTELDLIGYLILKKVYRRLGQ